MILLPLFCIYFVVLSLNKRMIISYYLRDFPLTNIPLKTNKIKKKILFSAINHGLSLESPKTSHLYKKIDKTLRFLIPLCRKNTKNIQLLCGYWMGECINQIP